MDTFVESSWYFLRYPSTDIDDRPWDAARTAAVLPVDFYAGGPEHVCRHHLYARFVTMAMHDLGHVDFDEPFPSMRLGGVLLHDGRKMNKSKGNVVVPEEYVERVGGDVLRCYLQFCSRWEEGGDFRDDGIAGIERFLSRVWRVVVGEPREDPAFDDRAVDRTIARVDDDIRHLRFNTALSALMELASAMVTGANARARRTLTLLLAPFAPYVAEELWCRLGEEYSVHTQPWPSFDRGALADATVTMVVQVDGKARDRVEVAAGLDEQSAVAVAMTRPRVVEWVDGRNVARVVHVPDRLLNLVTGDA